MAQLRQEYSEFQKREAEVVVVGPENSAAFARVWAKGNFPFLGLPDPEHSVLKRFGQEVRLFKLGRMPAQVIVDKAGVARFGHYGHSMRDIPANEELIALLDRLQAGNS